MSETPPKWETVLGDPPVEGCDCYLCEAARENIELVETNMRLGVEVTTKEARIAALETEIKKAQKENDQFSFDAGVRMGEAFKSMAALETSLDYERKATKGAVELAEKNCKRIIELQAELKEANKYEKDLQSRLEFAESRVATMAELERLLAAHKGDLHESDDCPMCAAEDRVAELERHIRSTDGSSARIAVLEADLKDAIMANAQDPFVRIREEAEAKYKVECDEHLKTGLALNRIRAERDQLKIDLGLATNRANFVSGKLKVAREQTAVLEANIVTKDLEIEDLTNGARMEVQRADEILDEYSEATGKYQLSEYNLARAQERIAELEKTKEAYEVDDTFKQHTIEELRTELKDARMVGMRRYNRMQSQAREILDLEARSGLKKVHHPSAF